jgi:hypothetical protein
LCIHRLPFGAKQADRYAATKPALSSTRTRRRQGKADLEILEAEVEDREERRACRCWNLPSAESDDPATLGGPGRMLQTSLADRYLN